MRHVLEELFRCITLMQWRHLLKHLCVSGGFSLLQNAPILRLQFQVNIFKNSPNKQMRFRINAEFLSATQGYCAQLSSRESFVGECVHGKQWRMFVLD